jgi:proline iminopeptidase
MDLKKWFKPTMSAAALIVIFLFLTAGACQNKATETSANKRESILDRVVDIEPGLITEIPKVSRWCDRLDPVKQRINVGDAELYVEEEGQGTPLILINGGPGGTHHCFHPWFSRVKDYVRVIYYDQRGCGLSDFNPGENGYSVDQAVSDLDALRKAKKIDKWVALGYSYGGFLAQYYTINYPEHVAGLILLGAAPGMRTDTGRSRQDQFLSDRERARIEETRKQLKQLSQKKNLPHKEYIQLLIYNSFINGGWKCQHFYKPSRERIAMLALYEWDHDNSFNGILNDSMSLLDLTGVFALNPVPTLILEGKWDLTWGEEKPGILKKNHPHAQMVIFDNAGHGIYDEAPDKFFMVLKDFIQRLPRVPDADIAAFKAFIADWYRKRRQREKESPGYFLKTIAWGKVSSKKLVAVYSRAWLEKFKHSRDFLRTGFALYDVENYREALLVFERMQACAEAGKDVDNQALSLIWQGHMLDLMGRRDQAVSRYRQVKEMNINRTWRHYQYGLEYQLSPYAGERVKVPFKRIENNNLY